MKRRRKHPRAPKHPLSAYLFFVATHRPGLTIKYSECSFSDIARILGSVWKRVPKSEKRKYEMLAVADKLRYKYEMEDWTPPPDEESVSEASKGLSELFNSKPSPSKKEKSKVSEASQIDQIAAQAIAELATYVYFTRSHSAGCPE